ncbi:MAG: hypothetical protein JNL30_11510 [Rubrivivax sp.]|nr:hypothetical protein [Rubrivivax sp.]
MNTPRQTTPQRLAAFALALVMTVGMLGTVQVLATIEPGAAQLARAQALHGARS